MGIAIMAIHKVILTCSAAIFSGHGVYNIYTVILSPPSDYKNFWVASPSQRPFYKKYSRDRVRIVSGNTYVNFEVRSFSHFQAVGI